MALSWSVLVSRTVIGKHTNRKLATVQRYTFYTVHCLKRVFRMDDLDGSQMKESLGEGNH